MGEIVGTATVLVLIIIGWVIWETVGLRRGPILARPELTPAGRGSHVSDGSLHEVETAIAGILAPRAEDDHRETSSSDQPGRGPDKRFSFRDGVVPGLVAAGVGGVEWWKGDPDVMQAVEHLTHQDINDVLDLWQTVHEKDYDLVNEHFLRMLRGHVGEAHVFRELTDAGVGFSVPDTSNFPGLDMTVGDVDLNVKIGQSTSAIAEHLRTYPDIPVLVNEDMAGLPADAFHVLPEQLVDPSILEGHSIIVMDGLQLSGIQDQISDVMGFNVFTDGTQDFDAGQLTDGLEIPVLSTAIRVARVGTREYKNAQVHGDMRRAALNTATDAAATGAGVAVGTTVGAGIGVMVDIATGGLTLGLGTVFGKIIGAGMGGIAGRAAGTHLKDGPLRDAQHDAAVAVEEYGEASQAALDQANQEWTSRVESEQKDLNQTAERLRQEAREITRRAQDEQDIMEAGFSAAQHRTLERIVGEVRHRRTWGLVALRRRNRWLTAVDMIGGETASRLSLRSQVRGELTVIEQELDDLGRRRAALQARSVLLGRQKSSEAIHVRAAAITALRSAEPGLKRQVRSACVGPAQRLWRANQHVRVELVKTGHLTQEKVDTLFPAQPEPK